MTPQQQVEEAIARATHTVDATRKLAAGMDKLAAEQKAAGGSMAEAFADYALSKDLDEDTRAVAEMFVAWREVGEAQVSLAGQLCGLAKSLREQAARCESEVALRGREADGLLRELADVYAPRWGLLQWLFGRTGASGCAGRPPSQLEQEAERARKEGLYSAISASIVQVAEGVDAIRDPCKASLTDALAEGRRQAKAVGEKMSMLRPSWRGCAETRRRPARDPPAGSNPPGSPSTNLKVDTPRGDKVDKMIRTLATADSRQKALDAEAAAEAQKLATEGRSSSVEHGPPMMAPPVDVVGESEWRIRGVYDHQVLKAGLRLLEEAWRLQGPGDFPRGKDGGSVMLREGLLRDLLSGKIRLQSVPNNDVSAAQSDVKRLSLPQLLKLRVLHLDFTPSGCGADTVHSVGDRQEAFLALLDGLLFQELGKKAAGVLSGGVAMPSDDLAEEWHRLGREAVLFYAAASAVASSRWWCWWLTDTRRAYFDATAFACSSSFPDTGQGGALEVTDHSKPDKHDPSGRLTWMDWRISLVAEEASLSPGPTGPGRRAQAGKDLGAAQGGRPPHGDAGPQPEADAEAPAGAAGAATAGLVSPELLRGMRGSLRGAPP